jgi:hypothetical protein
MELAFAGLHQLCMSTLDRIDRLPGPQRLALGAAFGLDVVADPSARYFGAVLAERTLVPGDGAQLGETSFSDWLGRAR